MPDVRDTSVFLEEPDLSVEGGISQPAEGRERGLSRCVAAEASGVPGNSGSVRQQHPGSVLRRQLLLQKQCSPAVLFGSGHFVFFLKRLNSPWSFPRGLHPLPPGARVVLGSTRVRQMAAFARGPWWNLSLLKTMQQKNQRNTFFTNNCRN